MLGGFLRVRDKSTTEALGIFRLTSYHFIRPMIQGYEVSKTAREG